MVEQAKTRSSVESKKVLPFLFEEEMKVDDSCIITLKQAQF